MPWSWRTLLRIARFKARKPPNRVHAASSAIFCNIAAQTLLQTNRSQRGHLRAHTHTQTETHSHHISSASSGIDSRTLIGRRTTELSGQARARGRSWLSNDSSSNSCRVDLISVATTDSTAGSDRPAPRPHPAEAGAPSVTARYSWERMRAR